AGPRGLPFDLMLITRTADRRPIFFEHRGEDLQARCHRKLHQLRPHINEQINERQMALGWRIDLVGPIDCARLSLHGGSLLAGFRPGLVTTRLSRAVRSRRSQISTISGTSPDGRGEECNAAAAGERQALYGQDSKVMDGRNAQTDTR